MSGKVYGVTVGSDSDIDLSVVRGLLSSDTRSAKQQLKALSDILLLEENIGVDDVDVSFEVGVYVRSVQYVDSENIKMTFNNGRDVLLSQRDGVYSIGEHVFSMSKRLVGAFDMNLLPYHKVTNSLLSTDLYYVSNFELTNMMYHDLPNVRKNCEDDFYNYYNTTSYSSRIAQFRSYLVSGLYEVFSNPMTGDDVITIACIAFGKKSSYVIEDLIISINTDLLANSSQRYELVFLRMGELFQGRGPVCYFFDAFVSPASIDFSITASSKSEPNITNSVKRSLADYEKYIHSGSSVLLSAYKPIRDVFIDGSDAYSLKLDDYVYSQFSYVPHKPWTLINVSRSDGFQFDLRDSSYVDPLSRYAARLENDAKTIVINYRRNYRAANSKSREKMKATYGLVIQKMLGELKDLDVSIKLEDWYHDKVMKRPVEVTKTLVHGVETDVKLALEVTSKVSRMRSGVSYSYKDLQVAGWGPRCLERALYLDLIIPNKSGSVYSYLRKDKFDRGIKGYFYDSYVTNSPSHTLLDSLGGTVSSNSSASDRTVSFLDVPLVAAESNENYQLEAPYPISAYADRAVGLSISLVDTFDHDEFLTDTYSFSAYLDSRKTKILSGDGLDRKEEDGPKSKEEKDRVENNVDSFSDSKKKIWRAVPHASVGIGNTTFGRLKDDFANIQIQAENVHVRLDDGVVDDNWADDPGVFRFDGAHSYSRNVRETREEDDASAVDETQRKKSQQERISDLLNSAWDADENDEKDSDGNDSNDGVSGMSCTQS